MNDTTRRPPASDNITSDTPPNVTRSPPSRPARRAKAGGHRTSSLQLQQVIDRPSSIRQLHSIISPIKPSGSPGELSRRVLGVSAPSSIDRAEPCPRQTCATTSPRAAARRCSIQSVISNSSNTDHALEALRVSRLVSGGGDSVPQLAYHPNRCWKPLGGQP